MIKTIIVEDDLMHVESLVKILHENFKNVQIEAICTNVPDAVKKIDTLKPHLVFLDVEMGPFTGFDVLEMVKRKDFEVIFTTAYEQYAIRAIKTAALDYIEKPVNVDKLTEALARYKLKTGAKKIQTLLENFKNNSEEQKVALYDKGCFLFVKLKDIIRLHSDNAYTEVFYKEDKKVIKTLTSKGISYFEDLFQGKALFYRVHNQHLININYIRQMIYDNGLNLKMDDSEKSSIPVARARKEDFMLFLKQNGILI